ncbi:sigma-70 region 4 domain-containing protein [Catenulispora sp. NL8]|uniref:Sigma-70 region 4 domain-containing protein n=1 Tax=Catenulispora pinistramenti TaxID=2705254 RepID=A0ABS5KGJ4_9ACTN|nr:sigma-70 region 4 domain-containing protein [Catenulispora pinistramenti]MBS2545403.1 sigma-70 region 4 domain-containing protein [Catenulispora pinistramenti]
MSTNTFTTYTATRSSSPTSSPFYAAECAFNRLTTGPNPLTLDGMQLGEPFPAQRLMLDAVREIVLKRSNQIAPRDAVWVELVRNVRTYGGDWTIAAVGMALPALKWLGGAYAMKYDGHPADLDGEILTGFLEHLVEVDIDRPGIMTRLRFAALRAARRAVDQEIDYTRSVAVAESMEPYLPWGHEDLLLAKAHREGIISAADVDLIGMTRLEGVDLAEAAEMLGVSRNAVKIRRQRAEARLVAWLQGRRVPSMSDMAQSRARA